MVVYYYGVFVCLEPHRDETKKTGLKVCMFRCEYVQKEGMGGCLSDTEVAFSDLFTLSSRVNPFDAVTAYMRARTGPHLQIKKKNLF